MPDIAIRVENLGKMHLYPRSGRGLGQALPSVPLGSVEGPRAS
jgi:hypothetical protein